MTRFDLDPIENDGTVRENLTKSLSDTVVIALSRDPPRVSYPFLDQENNMVYSKTLQAY